MILTDLLAHFDLRNLGLTCQGEPQLDYFLSVY
jgi:hypothetical protein